MCIIPEKNCVLTTEHSVEREYPRLDFLAAAEYPVRLAEIYAAAAAENLPINLALNNLQKYAFSG